MTEPHRAIARYAALPEDPGVLIKRFSGIIERCARSFAARTVGGANVYDDLWSAGAYALVEAAGRFDAARGARFETFVEHRVRGAMLDELRRLDHLPRRLRQHAERTSKVRRELSQTLGRDPTADEVAHELEITVEDLHETAQATSLHVPFEDEHEPTFDLEVDDQLIGAQNAGALTAAVAQLPDRLKLVVSLRYVEELSLKEIATILGVSQPRVCQLHNDAIRRLRETLSAPEAE